MYYIPVILGSIRKNRESAKVAKFVIDLLAGSYGVNAELIDLKELDLPMLEDRSDLPPQFSDFRARIDRANSVVIVAPEYNGGYPGVLKNALDYLKDEFRRKPFGIVTVSSAWSGGLLCLVSLRQVIMHRGGIPVPATLSVSVVQQSFDGDGNSCDPAFQRRASAYLDELLWLTEAMEEQRNRRLLREGQKA